VRKPSGAVAISFSCIGHLSAHYFMAFYFVAVLDLETDWGRPYADLVELWTLGAVLVGLGALPAGWIADRWSAPRMMVVMFFGLGASAWFSSHAQSPSQLRAGLAAIGLFASIYHPVGVAWVVRSARQRGRALGINGVFGSLGVATAAVVTGWLVERAGWRAAFAIPGVVAVAIGFLLAGTIASGWVADVPREHQEQAHGHGDRWRSFVLLLAALACVGLIFQATQTALPKHFEARLSGFFSSGTLGVGVAVALVYFGAGFVQLVGGYLADRYALRTIYVTGLLLQAPVLVLVSRLTGLSLIGAAFLAAVLNASVLPAENLLLARVVPARHHSLAYGVKFVVAFGVAPLAVQLVAWVADRTGQLDALFLGLSVVAAFGAIVVWTIPEAGRQKG